MRRVLIPQLGRMWSVRGAVLVAVTTVALFGAASTARAAHTLTVCPAGPPQCQFATVQDALAAASDGDRILIAAGTYVGGFTIDTSVSLIGAGASQTTISGGDPDAVTISPGTSVEIRGLTITAATQTGIVSQGTLTLSYAAVSANGGFCGGCGVTGGIANNGVLTLRNSTVTRNEGIAAGGLSNDGSATIVDSTFDVNEGLFDAGNIQNQGQLELRGSTVSSGRCQYACAFLNTGSGATALIVDTVVSGNTAENVAPITNQFGGSLTIRRSILTGGDGAFGAAGALSNVSGLVTVAHSSITDNTAVATTNGPGAIRNAGTMTLENSTVSGNVALYDGGGLGNYGTMMVRNSTVSGNTALGGGGGGIYNAGSLALRGSTMSDNTAETIGGGILNYGNAELTNSSVTGNSAVQGLNGLFGGGIYNAGTITLRNTGVSGNIPDDCVGC